ncbi:YheC/YheD family protein [Herbivorax sp. ANBcel31]|uniref:YheC/YheD family endospore coat-associated protein n=1 Tax=Herbivorax sp. ANBcel31 TaxID=3069754 RepID=UPI0027B689FB|nr:YheC/YheD family protein [Herbivorax sp. ANBcel31]MDQ2084881.1 YheC/YheD family protein [Herbivorax sp. ANBcel31]
MLVKIEVIPGNDNIVTLPPPLLKDLEKHVWIIFGAKKIKAQVNIPKDNNLQNQSTLSDIPIKIAMSNSLKNQLLIPEEITYQIKLYKSQIILGPVIGFLISKNRDYYNISFLNSNRDRMEGYNQRGGLICAFSLEKINWQNKSAYGYYYNKNKNIWVEKKVPIPSVIYSRIFSIKPERITKLKKLTKDRVFNSYRFTKYELYEYFQKQEQLIKYLPKTELCKDIKQVTEFIENNNKVILKPINLSRGRGICIIEKTNYGYRIFDYRKNTEKKHRVRNKKLLIHFLNDGIFLNQTYLIQKYISLAKIESCPYDVRVVMQKVNKNKWGYIGEECRVGQKTLLTNISRGGYAVSLKKAITKSFKEEDYEDIKTSIMQLCDKICCHMDRAGEHFGELGIDIGIDNEKKLWLIEINVLPTFKGFKKLDYNLYLTLRSTPLQYAVSLTEFGDSYNELV